jgi:two-component system repressor protein LuxO
MINKQFIFIVTAQYGKEKAGNHLKMPPNSEDNLSRRQCKMAHRTDSILLVEDSPPMAMVYIEYLRKHPCQINHVATGAEALKTINTEAPDLILLDLQLPDMNGLAVLTEVKRLGLSTAVIVITAHGSMDIAVEIMRNGADDFIEKPFSADRLLVTVQNALRRRSLEAFVDLQRQENFHGFIGASLIMQSVYRIIKSVAASKATVFITGESGTGKEVCARAIHDESPRNEQPFIALNCASIPKELMESEVFGHVKGAFTGAVSARDGAATQADGGTLFLDEICEMDLDLQSKLLRFIQTSIYQKVGSSVQKQADIRFICATNRDPLEEVKAGRFREDLYYRLHVIPIALPPLRQRESDITLVSQHFLHQYSKEEDKSFQGFNEQAEATLRAYHWPGNVRQLQNVLRNIVVLHDGALVTPQMLPPPLDCIATEATGSHSVDAYQPVEPASITPADNSTITPLWQVEKETIEHAISFCENNIPRAATLLEISPSTIYRKLQQWETAGSRS